MDYSKKYFDENHITIHHTKGDAAIAEIFIATCKSMLDKQIKPKQSLFSHSGVPSRPGPGRGARAEATGPRRPARGQRGTQALVDCLPPDVGILVKLGVPLHACTVGHTHTLNHMFYNVIRNQN